MLSKRRLKIERDIAKAHRINGGVGIFWRKAVPPKYDSFGMYMPTRQHVWFWLFGLKFDLSWDTVLKPVGTLPDTDMFGNPHQ